MDTVLYPDNFKKATACLNKLVSHEDYGFWYSGKNPGPRHGNKNEAIIEYKTRQRNWLGGITRKMYDRHFRGETTYYFTASEYNPYVLVNIDVDCKRKGTREGAIAFLDYLKRTVFPNLFHEVSTGGRGGHGYLIVYRANVTAAEVNEWLRRLQTYLREVQHRFDIEFVEIKGHCRELVMDGRRLVDVKAGELAKLPREIVRRWDEWTKQSVVDMTTFGFPALSGAVVIEKKEKSCGSVAGKHVREWRTIIPLARRLMGVDRIKANKDIAVVPEDVALLLAILRHCTLDGNEDGSMPTARIKALWESVYSSGDTDRQWHGSRYRAARQVIESASGITWKDRSYHFGYAAKWSLSEAMMAELNAATEAAPPSAGGTHTPFMVGSPSTSYEFRFFRPARKAADRIIDPEPAWKIPPEEEVLEIIYRVAA